MRLSHPFKTGFLALILLSFVVPAVFAQGGPGDHPPVQTKKLTVIIIEGIAACKGTTLPGDRIALRSCLKEKIIAFLREKRAQKRQTGGVASPPSTTALPSPRSDEGQFQEVKVVKVIDGDTVEIETGERVRYIGIDTPETVDPRKPVQCYGKEASAKNKELVEGMVVRLEKDISNTDRYGRLLRYVSVGDTLINELLVQEGYAFASSYPPDVKYQARLAAAEQAARSAARGLWGGCPATHPVPSPVSASPTPPSTPGQSSSDHPSCSPSVTCGSLSSCDEALYFLNSCGQKRLDRDSDGIPCESLCQ